MIECSSCQTLNPGGEAACLACGAPLRKETAAEASGATRCPNGHPIDPTWRTCPYCERTQTGGTEARLEVDATRPLATRLEPRDGPLAASARRTRLEGEPVTPEPPPPPGRPVPTRLEPQPSTAGRRTVLEDGGAAATPKVSAVPAAVAPAGSALAPAHAGRLVGVLAAPGLGPQGAVFAVRAGKNVIGSDRTCDVVIEGDGQVSRDHAVVLFRGGVFQLADRLSTNGTSINGSEVPANGAVQLHHHDRIRVGGTELLFFAIERPEFASATQEAGPGLSDPNPLTGEQ